MDIRTGRLTIGPARERGGVRFEFWESVRAWALMLSAVRWPACAAGVALMASCARVRGVKRALPSTRTHGQGGNRIRGAGRRRLYVNSMRSD